MKRLALNFHQTFFSGYFKPLLSLFLMIASSQTVYILLFDFLNKKGWIQGKTLVTETQDTSSKPHDKLAC